MRLSITNFNLLSIYFNRKRDSDAYRNINTHEINALHRQHNLQLVNMRLSIDSPAFCPQRVLVLCPPHRSPSSYLPCCPVTKIYTLMHSSIGIGRFHLLSLFPTKLFLYTASVISSILY